MHQHSFLSKEKRYLKTRKLYLNKFSEIDKNKQFDTSNSSDESGIVR